MATNRNVSIKVPVLARVEGEGALELDVRDGEITNIKLRIFEPPRYFEKFLEGRSYDDVVDAVARICGICPVAYQMSAAQALEMAFDMQIEPWVRRMRRAMYCGEWLQSHSLHVHLLAAPDFLGYESALEMAADHAEIVHRGLRLQRLGNNLISLFGGRSVHPIGMRVGGFHHAPEPGNVDALVHRLSRSLDEARELVAWAGSLDMPDDPQQFTSVAMSHADEFAVYSGDLHADNGLDIPIDRYDEHFEEQHIPHSTALHSLLDGQPYLVGPLARVNLNLDRLHPPVRDALLATGVAFPSRNMFHSLLARAVEIYQALVEAIELLSDYQVPARTFVPPTPRAGVGYGCSEAPRGILWHRYQTDNEGRIVNARIVPPTSQNQARIEQDLVYSLQQLGLDHSDDELRLRGETVIRNYDPCISCSTHFLKLKVNR